MLTEAQIQEDREYFAFIATKSDVDPNRELVWNTGADWAIPLPEYKVDGYFVSRHFIPDEAPVIPTGWIYEHHDGRLISEAELSRVEF